MKFEVIPLKPDSKTFTDAWIAAANQKDTSKLINLMTVDAKLVSPISFKDLSGRAAIEPIFRAILKVLPDLKYNRIESFAQGACLTFTGTLAGGLAVEGLDLFTLDAQSGWTQAKELKVFVRPLKAANLFAAEMQKALS